MKLALAEASPKEFQPPFGIELIPVNRRTGLRAQNDEEAVIIEAFNRLGPACRLISDELPGCCDQPRARFAASSPDNQAASLNRTTAGTPRPSAWKPQVTWN